LVVTDAGAGYAQPPALRLVGGGGRDAVVEPQIAAGGVTGFVVVQPGSGYTSAPMLAVAPPGDAPALGIAISEGGRVAIPQFLVPGRRYRLLRSANLKDWAPVGEAFLAEVTLTSGEFGTIQRAQFFRLDELP
jgi:hypothetical protein